jgi:hypothetical protein
MKALGTYEGSRWKSSQVEDFDKCRLASELPEQGTSAAQAF